MKEKINEFKLNKKIEILEQMKDFLTDEKDILANEEASFLFYILADKLNYLLDNDPDVVLSKHGVEIRKRINSIIRLIGPLFLSNKQIIENRNTLLNESDLTPDKKIILPDEPVIWTANHAFKDDVLATVLAMHRNGYILFGSLPQFYNTFDGFTAWLNGVIMVNRKSSESKKASLEKAYKLIDYGSDLAIFPEGVWNKTPNQLMLDLWPGVYRICKEKGCKVVPTIHYMKDCADMSKNSPIHTVVDDPIKIDDLSEKAALTYLRDVMATWYYLMLERYGKSTREEELKGFNNSQEAWEYQLEKRIKTAQRYDISIETKADYRPKEKRVDEIWENIVNIKNVTIDNVKLVEEAKQKVLQFKENDFQRRY